MAARDVERDRLIKKITEKRAKLEARTDLNIKVPRLTLPTDYNINDRSLFTLPPELLKPILASSYPKYKKKVAIEKRKGKVSYLHDNFWLSFLCSCALYF